MTPRPWTLIAELTYACALRCAYCSNPRRTPGGGRLPTAEWRRVLREAEALGVMQVHFTGGEPLLHAELEALVSEARGVELYSSLVTSGVPLERARLERLAKAGLDHVQLSIQSTNSDVSRQLAGADHLAQKLEVAGWVKELGLALTLNVVLTRHNLHEVDELVALAERVGPDRLELAHAQYLGWGLVNRHELLPSEAGLAGARAATARARQRVGDRLDIVAVWPDYFTGRPRACMGGWATQYLVVTPEGRLLPCHAAHGIAGLAFDDVRSAPLAELWATSPALQRYRGTAWMKDPCRSCPERARDFGGCRCQAFQLTGDASQADPACELSPSHHLVRAARSQPLVPAARLHLRRPPTRA